MVSIPMVHQLLCVLFIFSSIVMAHPLVTIDLPNKTPKQGDAIWIKIRTSKTVASRNNSIKEKKV